ncbi:hypothetical protein LSTR_LSTR011347 [Laodelphax striatellus]|uniref:Uncharacterized protein n=1 Tax=Laodelphax striatellus TaxID=195883 RepID=A0A482XT98_LAOST|nr:hypothetical protein LSTR_LSTR011347 [Laodelphax striatellus]
MVHELARHGTGKMKAAPGCTLSNTTYQILPSARARGHLELQKHLTLHSLPPVFMLTMRPGMTREHLLEGVKLHQIKGHLQPGELGVDEVLIDKLLQHLTALENPPSAEGWSWWLTSALICGAALAVAAALTAGVVWNRRRHPVQSKDAWAPAEVSTLPEVAEDSTLPSQDPERKLQA